MEGFEKPKMRPVSEVLSVVEKVKQAAMRVAQMFREHLGIDSVTERITEDPYFETERNI